MSDALASSLLARAMGFALVQFLWQGAAIGATAALVLAALRRSSAQARYMVACFALGAMVAAPVATAWQYVGDIQQTTAGSASVTASAVAVSVAAAIASEPVRASDPTTTAVIRAWLEPRLPFVVMMWGVGVFVLALQLLRAWLHIGRVHRTAQPIPASGWPEAVRHMARVMGVTPRLRLIESALVDVPAVIGFLRPAIVVPVSALAGLTPAHLEAIIAHELAHVRRGDYLLNAIQCVVEVLLFYHPAVWWVSREIRREREHCCDDAAASLCADRVAYARALASLEELRAHTPVLAVAATGGDLLNRIRRLLEPGSASGPTLSGRFAMIAVLTVLLAVSNHISGMPALPVAYETPQDPARVVTVERDETPLPLVKVERVVVPHDVAAAKPNPTPKPAPDPAPNPEPNPRPDVSQIASVQLPPSAQGQITGSVIDPQGGALPGATIIVGSTVSGIESLRRLVTNAAGRYHVGDLSPGVYDVAASMAGFRTARTRVQVGANELVSVSMRLQIGALSETILVRSGSSLAVGNPADIPLNPLTAAELFDAVKLYYQQGRVSEAEMMTTRALAQLRAENPNSPSADSTAAQEVTHTQVLTSPDQPTFLPQTAPIRVGGDIMAPRKIRDVKPIYPADALGAQVEGTVVIEAIIAKDGSVQDAIVLRSIPLLDQAALGAVRLWAFTPTKLNGVPVEVVMTVTVTFTR